MTAVDSEFLTFSGSLVERERQTRAARNHAVPFLLLLIALLLGVRQSYIVPSTGVGLSPAYLLGLLASVWWLIGKAMRVPDLGSEGLPIRFAIGGQLLTQVLGYVVLLEHPAPRSTPQQAQLLSTLILAGLAIFVADTLHTWTELDRVVRWLVMAGAVGALLALVAAVTHVDLAAITPPALRSEPQLSAPIPRGGVHRAQGTAAHPLELAAVMTTLFPLSLYCVTSARHRGRPQWPWYAALLLILAAGTLSVSRSFFVGIGVSVVVLALVWPLSRIGALLGVGAAGFAVFAFVDNHLISSLVTLFTLGSGDDSLPHRAFARDFAAHLVAQHPWLGLGWGSYDTTRFPVLDDQYLGVLAETGVVGLLGFVLFLAGGIYAALARLSRSEGPPRDLGATLAASITAFAVINLILDTSGFLQISGLAAVLVGLAGATYRYHLTLGAAR